MQNSDLDELKALVAELRAEHVADKEKAKRDGWTKYVSLTMIIIAVLAAIATLKGGAFSSRTLTRMNEAIFKQAKATDQWSYFEAVSIKQNLYELELDHLAASPNPDPALKTKIQAKLDKYDNSKRTITNQVAVYEGERDTAWNGAMNAAEHSSAMGLPSTLFQVSIALGGMCLIVKKKPLWFASMILGAIAVVRAIVVLYFMP